MDKAVELLQLNKVFNQLLGWRIQAGERPDFTVRSNNGLAIGIEVTSLYVNNTAAKLKNLPSYALALIDGNRELHRRDQGNIIVDSVDLKDSDGAHKARIRALIQQLPSMKERVEMLFDVIDAKIAKSVEYENGFNALDLIVIDESDLFYHDDFDDFFRPFWYHMRKSSLMTSRFREIYLLCRTKKHSEVYIPLTSAVFVADCFAYESFLSRTRKRRSTAKAVFSELLACLLHEGYLQTQVQDSAEGFGLLFGAWELLYSPEGKCLRDWMLPRVAYPGGPIAENVSMNAQTRTRVDALANKRASVFASIPLHLPVYRT